MRRIILFCLIICVIGVGSVWACRNITKKMMVEFVASNQIIAEYPSPDLKHKAVLFIRDAGATTRESYQLSIMKEDQNLTDSETGNVFVSYSEIEAEWENSKKLVIKILEKDQTIFKQETQLGNIDISYE